MPARGQVVRGRAAIETALSESLQKVRFSAGQIVSLETHLAGRLAYEIGRYRFNIDAGGGTQTVSGRYLVVWKNIADTWKIAVDAAQPGAPPR